MKKLLLIDAHALIHRSYHALPAFVSGTGEPTGALYGLSNILLKILKEEPPEYVAAFFDRPEPTFRKEMYNEYKSHRPKAADELVSQLIEAHNLFKEFGIKTYDAVGYEADDLLGAAAEQFRKEKDLQVVILTGDLDTLQLVKDDKVVVETLKKGVSETIIYNETAVIEKYGLLPKQLPDYKGLVGDVSDNIAGVKGIGPKTASEIIKQFGTLEEFFRTAKLSTDVSPRFAKAYETILQNKEIALLSKKLATIHLQAPLEIKNLEEIKYDKIPLNKVIQYFKERGFQSLIKRLESIADSTGLDAELREQKNKSAQLSLLEHNPSLSPQIIEEIEAPLTPILKEMEASGIEVDPQKLKLESENLSGKINELSKKIYQEAGQVFNINSPKQMLDILKKKFTLKIKATNYEKLIDYRNIPIVDLILSYRELFKLKSTYVEPLINLASASQDGRIHPTFVQLKAATGRITCENPNLQNIPDSIRNVFIAGKGYKLASFDYSQIELRIMASVSNDKNMLEAFKNNIDVHQLTASKIFNVPLQEVTNQMRKIAKTLNFGVMYGMGSRSFAQTSGVSQTEAKKFIAEYFKDFPDIKNWRENTIETARREGMVKNLNGRIRYLPEIISSGPRFQAEAERMAINFPIQSLAADIIKLAMIKTKEKLVEKNYWCTKAHMLLTIHDELVFEISSKEGDEKIKEIANLIKTTMESVYQLQIPLEVDMAIGDNWGEIG